MKKTSNREACYAAGKRSSKQGNSDRVRNQPGAEEKFGPGPFLTINQPNRTREVRTGSAFVRTGSVFTLFLVRTVTSPIGPGPIPVRIPTSRRRKLKAGKFGPGPFLRDPTPSDRVRRDPAQQEVRARSVFKGSSFFSSDRVRDPFLVRTGSEIHNPIGPGPSGRSSRKFGPGPFLQSTKVRTGSEIHSAEVRTGSVFT